MNGVLHRNGHRVASDGSWLVRQKAEYPAEHEGLSIRKDGSRAKEWKDSSGKTIDSIFDEAKKTGVEIKVEDASALRSLLGDLTRLLNYSTARDGQVQSVGVRVETDSGAAFFDGVRFAKFLSLADSEGAKLYVAKIPGASWNVLYVQNGETEGVLLPLRDGAETKIPFLVDAGTGEVSVNEDAYKEALPRLQEANAASLRKKAAAWEKAAKAIREGTEGKRQYSVKPKPAQKQTLSEKKRALRDALLAHIARKTGVKVIKESQAEIERAASGRDVRRLADFRNTPEYRERIEKLRAAKPVEITGNEIALGEDARENAKAASAYGLTLRGTYTNADTGRKIPVSRKSIEEIRNHDARDKAHLQAVAAIPRIIENGIYIGKSANEDVAKNANVKEYEYYICGLKIGGVDYTVKSVVSVDTHGRRYYDQRLTQIEKGALISANTASNAGGEINTPSIAKEDARLLWLLQANNSRLNEAFGELRYLRNKGVVYGYYDSVRKELHLNEDFADFDTPVHEWTHVWWAWVAGEDSRLTDKIVSLCKETKEFKQIKAEAAADADSVYHGLSDEELAQEVFARLVGMRGESIMAQEGLSVWTKIRRAALDFFKKVLRTLGLSKEEIEGLSFEDVQNMCLRDLFDGETLGLKGLRAKLSARGALNDAIDNAAIDNLVHNASWKRKVRNASVVVAARLVKRFGKASSEKIDNMHDELLTYAQKALPTETSDVHEAFFSVFLQHHLKKPLKRAVADRAFPRNEFRFAQNRNGFRGSVAEKPAMPEREKIFSGNGGEKRENRVAHQRFEARAADRSREDFLSEKFADGGQFSFRAKRFSGKRRAVCGNVGFFRRFAETARPRGIFFKQVQILREAGTRVIRGAHAGEIPRSRRRSEKRIRTREQHRRRREFQRETRHLRAVFVKPQSFENDFVEQVFPRRFLKPPLHVTRFLRVAFPRAFGDERFAFPQIFSEQNFQRGVRLRASFERGECVRLRVFLYVDGEVRQKQKSFHRVPARVPRRKIFLRREKQHVQHDVPERRIRVVSVREPVLGVKMKFDVADDALAADAQFRAEKIRTRELVPASPRNDFERFSRLRTQRVGAEIAAMPDFLKNAFGKRYGTEKTLNFGDGLERCVFGHGGSQAVFGGNVQRFFFRTRKRPRVPARFSVRGNSEKDIVCGA